MSRLERIEFQNKQRKLNFEKAFQQTLKNQLDPSLHLPSLKLRPFPELQSDLL
jgi:hypothetical protein